MLHKFHIFIIACLISSNVFAGSTPPSSASSFQFTSSDETCMGSSATGAQGGLFGLSFGSTWVNKQCNNRKDAVVMHNLGFDKVALNIMCQNEDVKLAMEQNGTPCPKVVVNKSSNIIYDYPTAKR